MAKKNKFIKGLVEKLTILADDWFVIQPDAEENIAYKIKKSNVKSDRTEPNTWYVNSAPEGNNSNVGSDKFPFETIKFAHDTAAENDTIIIQDIDFVQPTSPATSITKTIIIKGVSSDGSNQGTLKGTWTITIGKTLIIDMLATSSVTFAGPGNYNVKLSNGFHNGLTSSNRRMGLWLTNAEVFPGSLDIFSMVSRDSIIEGDINCGWSGQFYASYLVGEWIGGLDSSQNLLLSNSTIDGDVTQTGGLFKFNSVITGSEAVSGSTVDEVQTPNKLDKLSASDQTVASNVEFTKNVLADKLAADVATQLNTGDFGGGVAIGSGVAGISTAPADGLLVEGSLGVGTDTLFSKFEVHGPPGLVSHFRTVLGLVSESANIALQNGRAQFGWDGALGAFKISTSDSTKDVILANSITEGAGEYARFTGTGELGIGTVDPKNKVDVAGGMAIGSGVAGISTAPLDGLLVEGSIESPSNAEFINVKIEAAGADRRLGNTVNNRTLFFLGGSGSSGEGAYIRMFGKDFGGIDSSGGIQMVLVNSKSLILNTSMMIGGFNEAVTRLEVAGAITQHALSADPDDPANNSFVKWQSDGTGTGDDGDIIMKITDSSGTTKLTTLIDFSAI